MTGGGFGGSAIALVRRRRREVDDRAVEEAFAAAGLAAPNRFAVTASGPAARDTDPARTAAPRNGGCVAKAGAAG